MTDTTHLDSNTVSEHTKQWLEKAVIGLNLCPFAKAAEAFPDASAIFDRNIALLEKMGHEGWDKLDIPRCPFPHHKLSENK